MDSSEKGNCVYCGAVTSGVSLGFITLPAPQCCASPDCITKNDAAIRDADRKRIIQSTPPLNVPPVYRDTDLTKLPARCAHAAQKWTPESGKGNLLVHGTTRTGKSRTAWYIASRLHPFPQVTHLSMREIEFQLSEGYARGTWHRSLPPTPARRGTTRAAMPPVSPSRYRWRGAGSTPSSPRSSGNGGRAGR
jgi:hypothetical protein